MGAGSLLVRLSFRVFACDPLLCAPCVTLRLPAGIKEIGLTVEEPFSILPLEVGVGGHVVIACWGLCPAGQARCGWPSASWLL